MIIFCIGIAGFFVYQMPKQWEKSTDRIVDKLVNVINETQDVKNAVYELSKKYDEHDVQAKIILRINEDIKDSVDNIKRS
jgi:hypothetical protein